MFVQTIILMRKNLLCKLLSIVAIMILIFAIGCKRTEIPVTPDPLPTNPTGSVVNDAAQVTASVSGIVLDETNAPIASAVVTSGTATTTTNSNGMFIFQNISLSKENGNVTVVKAGYFKGIRSFKTTEGKNHTVRIQLMQRVSSGTVNAAAGGTITSNGGAAIIFPANAFVTSTGAAYTGTVTVYSRWIDPTAANLPFVIPGDLRGVSTTGVENILETYGMVGAELADASGNVLKIATGKTATVSFPIPASLSATAPTSIVLWHFDEATARWKENGTATKTGSTYTAQVDKFSFWNCDVGSTNFINLDYTLINATINTPLVSTSTRIKRANGTYGYGYTNNAGFVSGLVPKNEVLVLEVVAISGCNTVAYSQNIGPFAANTSLGNINITIPPSQYISFTGTLVNCSAVPVTNGYVSLYAIGGGGAYAATNATGSFSFSILNCSGTNVTYNYQGTDNTTAQQSAVLTGNASSGTINLGNVNACGAVAAVNVYVAGETTSGATIWKNNLPITIATRPDSSYASSVFVSGTDVYVAGTEGKFAKVWKNGVPTNLTNGVFWARAKSIFVLGNDVYVAGNDNSGVGFAPVAKMWKNGIATNLSNGTNSAYANSIYVSGTDIYVAGNERVNGVVIAKVWKNGISINLTTGTNFEDALSVLISGNDVYVAGYTSGGAAIWKNSIATNLGSQSSASSVFVLGTDVYVSGEQSNGTNSKATIWKNGVATNLTDGTTSVSTSSIFVFGTDVYVTGYDASYIGGNYTSVAKMWKNGLLTNLTNGVGYGSANSVFVK
jgi:hypothetical protein